MAYLLAIDQGTTSSRAIVFDTTSNTMHVAQREFPQHFPHDGWVEHDPEDIWNTTLSTFQEAIQKAKLSDTDIAAIGITNQRETTIVWDRDTGKPIYNAIIWQDRRTSKFCDQLKQQGLEKTIQKKTGLLIDPYFSASKIRWILDNVEGVRRKAEAGKLAFGTVDCFLLWRLTGGKVHKTDATNASRTSLFNIHSQTWDEELLEIFNIPDSILPEVCDNTHDYGATDSKLTGHAIPIGAMIGDQQSALVGQACFKKGMAKSTYGTGCFLVLNTGGKALESKNKLLTTVGYRLNGKVNYALEGSIFIAGAAIQWLRDGLHLIKDAKETEALAEKTPIDHGVFLVPAFTGLGAPYWDPNARGGIFGLTRDTGIAEIVSAGLQSVAYQTKDLQEAMEADGQRPTTFRVDGGMAANNWLMQFLADLSGADIQRPKIIETTALGAAQLAGLQVGVFSSLDEISQDWQEDKTFTSLWEKEARDELYGKWKNSVGRVKT